MKVEFGGSCQRLREALAPRALPECCQSCHAEPDDGASWSELELDGKWYEVCCGLASVRHEVKEVQWA